MKVEVIAEIANAHQGDPALAFELARAASEAGADAVKFQMYTAAELLVESHPRYEHFRRQSFASDVWRDLLARARGLGTRVYADVFGMDSLSIAVSAAVDGLKLHSSDLVNAVLLDGVREHGLPVYLGVGGSTVPEIRYAVDRLTSGPGPTPRVVLLHGFQAYPTAISDAALNRITELRDLFGGRAAIGYADHVAADDEFAFVLPLMAVSLGAEVLEKHVTLDRAAQGVDWYSSLEPEEFARFVGRLREAEAARAEAPLRFSEAERAYRRTVKKHWVTTRSLSEGHVLTLDDLTMKRVHEAADSPPLEALLGRPLAVAKKLEEPIARGDVSHKVLAVVVARSASSRLPGKATLDVAGRPALQHLFERLKLALDRGYVDTVAFCTTTAPEDGRLVELAAPYPFLVYRGSVEDVLSRMMLAIEDHPDHEVCLRITGDDLLVDPDYLHQTVLHHLARNAQYTDAKGLPSGTEVEVFDAELLRMLHDLLRDGSGTEYLTSYVRDHADQFRLASLPIPEAHAKPYRLTLDTPEDYEVIRGLLEHMKLLGRELDYTLDDVCAYFAQREGASAANATVRQRATPPSVDTTMDWASYTTAPLVTVYITNHNYGRYLDQAIQSVLRQKFRDFELIVIDDGSTDDSRAILQRYQGNARVAVIFQENKGLSVSNNIAANLARGKYVMRLDADDWLEENALLVMVNRMEREPRLALVFPDYYLVDEDGQILGQHHRHDFREVTLLDEPAHGACTLIRRDVLMQVGGYSEEFECQDGYDLWLKVAGHFPVGNVNLPLFYYRQHEGSLTRDQDRLLATRHAIVDKHAGDLGLEGLDHLCIVPVRRSRGPVPLALLPFAGTTLLDLTLRSVIESGRFGRVCLTTTDDRILEHAAPWRSEILLDRRPDLLGRLNAPIEETIDYLFDREIVPPCDTLTVANYEYPFRKPMYLEKAINLLYLFEADSVMSVQKENANFFRHTGHGLAPFDTNRSLHLEQSAIFREIGGIHGTRYEAYRKHRRLVGGTVTHVVIDDLAAVQITSAEELSVYEPGFRRRAEGAAWDPSKDATDPS